MRLAILVIVGGCGFSSNLAGTLAGDDAPVPDAPTGDGMMTTAAACARLAPGSDHTCALRAGAVYCWGSGSFGVLGGGSRTSAVVLPQTRHLASSKYTTCAVAMDGTVRCWGINDGGQLGGGTFGGESATPVVVQGMTGAVQAGVGRSQACARRANGTIRCWGSNTSGQLGDGTTTSRATAVNDVENVTGMVDVAFTASHVCAHDANGAAKCWGSNVYGQLGDGTTTDQPSPIAGPVAGVTWIGTASFSSGVDVGAQTCAIVGGAVQCWGDNAFGQLGDGTTTDAPTPVAVAGITDAVQVVMGRWHACARHATGRVSCWGRNLDGEVGDGTQVVRSAPVDVGLTDVLELGAGGFHTCALNRADELYCWGLNTSQQLGIATGARYLSPTKSFALCP